MKSYLKGIAALMLMTAMIVAVGCNPEDDPSNGGDNGNGGFIPEYVDLGLPSGTLWSTCNLGANTPEDYGDYFAWGDSIPKVIYDWSTYKYCMNGYDKLTKYCSNSYYGYKGYTDTLSVLEADDDAASITWGDGWRMPTSAEWEELFQYTEVSFVRDSVYNLYGIRCTANNTLSIFLPAAGERYDAGLYGCNRHGSYWSSTLDAELPSRSCYFYFDWDEFRMTHYYRYYGRSVRPVRSAIRTKG